VTKGLKALLKVKLIKEIRTPKNVTKRIYMLSRLEPTDESTGGNFYTDGELDVGLIQELNAWLVNYVQGRSWDLQKRDGKNLSKRKASEKTAAQSIQSATGPERPIFQEPVEATDDEQYTLIPKPSEYYEYPTAEEIGGQITEQGVLKDKDLARDDVEQLVRQLVFDGRLEEMTTGRYRSVREVWERDILADTIGPLDPNKFGVGPGNGLTQTPCARCPVRRDCKVGGIVSPETCVYMDEWFKSDLEF
jgi:DNA-directed RNA polymerase III subunit RPC6